jgi:hypothetical protein
MAVVVAVDESGGSSIAIRLTATEAGWRRVPLIAVTAYRAAGAPAGRRAVPGLTGPAGRLAAP